jgi:signal transduction histidine kinase
VLVDEDGRIRVLNSAAELILGVTLDEARGLPITGVSPDWEDVSPRIPVTKPDGLSAPAVVIPLTTGYTTRWLSASGEPAADGVVYTLRDVTEERRLEEMRDDIVTIVSHELRTPLAGVYGAAQTLASIGARLDERQREELIQVIAEQSGRLNRVLEQVLVTQRLDSGQLGLERRSFDVGECIERVVEAARGWRDTRPIEVTCPEPIAVQGDPRLFEQALEHIVDNAVKYSPPDSDVRIGVQQLGASARVTVADGGPGVPDGVRDRIFEKFFRLDPQQRSGTTGTGLGLYIARELIRRMNGRIGLLQSDRGATFFVDVPLHHTNG